MLYADTSAIARAYLPDEREHRRLRRLLLESEEKVATSAVARVELGSAARRAGEAGRLPRWRETLAQFDADCAAGVLTLLALRAETVLPRAYDLVTAHPLRALDAIHLATALDEDADSFVTRDARQAEAAAALGLPVR